MTENTGNRKRPPEHGGNNGISDTLLLKYLEGAASAEEAQAVEAYLARDETAYQTVAGMIHRRIGSGETDMAAVEARLRRTPEAQVAAVLEEYESLNPESARRPENVVRMPQRERIPFALWWAAAAAVVLLLVTGYLGVDYYRTDYQVAAVERLLQDSLKIHIEDVRISGEYRYSYLGTLMSEREGYMEAARKRLEGAIAAGVDDRQARRLLAQVRLKEGDYAAAESLLTALLKGRPDDAALLNDLGAVHFRQGRFRAAQERFQAALNAEPAFLKPLFNLFLVRREEGDIEGARKALEQYLTMEKDEDRREAARVLMAKLKTDSGERSP